MLSQNWISVFMMRSIPNEILFEVYFNLCNRNQIILILMLLLLLFIFHVCQENMFFEQKNISLRIDSLLETNILIRENWLIQYKNYLETFPKINGSQKKNCNESFVSLKHLSEIKMFRILLWKTLRNEVPKLQHHFEACLCFSDRVFIWYVRSLPV